MDTAKIFQSGRSQAVRLPKAFRFEGTAVRIRRQGAAVILEPLASDWAWLDGVHGQLDRDAADHAVDQPQPQTRDELAELLR